MENTLDMAAEFLNQSLTESEVCEILSGNDDLKKVAAILNIEKFFDMRVGELLIFNLTNQNGIVREACAFKINQIAPFQNDFLQSKTSLDKIIAALNDVNPNVVRFVLEVLDCIQNKKYILETLLQSIRNLYIEILNKPRRGKVEEHIFTKKCFKIYWALEAVKTIIKLDNNALNENSLKEELNSIINDLVDFEEYTIREKVAQIVKLLPNFENTDIKRKLDNDKNYFVKRIKYENING